MTQTVSAGQIRIEQIRSIYRTTGPGTFSTLVTVFMLTGGMIYIGAATWSRAGVFLAVMFIQAVARLALIHRFLRTARESENWRPWAAWFTLGTFVGGATIGTGAIWMVTGQSNGLQLIAFLLVFAVTAGAVGAYSAYLPAFYAFFAAVSAVPLVWVFLQGDGLHITIGIVFVMWIVSVGEQARRLASQFAESIQLRLERVSLVQDLRREKAVAEEANVAKSRFLAAASHDLRQPVHALSVLVGAMRAHQMDAKARGLLDHIDGSVRALSGLFGGLLDISRLDAGIVEVHRVSFALQPIVERVCREYESLAREKGLKLTWRTTREAVLTDPMLFERILRNILVNAITYTDRGRILVGYRRRGSHLWVQIQDTGRGIAPEEQSRIFQEFYQVGNPERDRTRGVGLGLAIVRRLTTLLDHPLKLQSRPGQGTCFSIEVPRTNALPQVNFAELAAARDPVAPGSGLILVVDDEGAIQSAMQSLLESWGYAVIAAGSYEETLRKVADCTQHPGLIICDYRLRDNETGTAVIERLRNEYNDAIPGMLITGDTAPDRIKEAQASGYLLLHKPVPNEVLRAAIGRLLQPAAASVA
jgi:signal transduction histidine kinase/CheY-like chemotaxis protein